MKPTYYIILSLFCSLLFAACDQDIDYAYQGKDRIHFKHYNLDWRNNRIPIDSMVFSFGMKSTDIRIDTAKIVVEYLGRNSDTERIYHVTVNPDSTTAVVGQHYEAIPRTQRFRAGSLTDTLRIVLMREYLSPSFSNPQNESIHLKLEASEDFDLGLANGVTLRLLVNNYLSEPVWWEGTFWGTLGFYHPQKWRILMSFHDDFKNPESCPFNPNNEGRGYTTGLSNYLNAIPTYDEETGDRIYMNTMVPVQ